MTSFSATLAIAVYVALGYTFAHITFNKTEVAFREGRIHTPAWGRFILSLAVIIIWPAIPLALTVHYVTQYWRKNV